MTPDRALDILTMSEQARWKDGIEPEDEKKAVETIRKALQSKGTLRRVEIFKGKEKIGIYYYDESRQLIVTGTTTRAYAERNGYTVKMLDEEAEKE